MDSFTCGKAEVGMNHANNFISSLLPQWEGGALSSFLKNHL